MGSAPPIYPFFKGRVALHAILRAAGIGSGDQVIVPGYTCVVVPNAVLYAGATPVYGDVVVESGNIDIDKLEQDIGRSWEPPKAKAIIAQHTYGVPCDMDAIARFAADHKLMVIEDSCHALGSKWRGRLTGTMGDAAFFSSQWSKPITTGLGGWAQLNSVPLRSAMDSILANYKRPSALEALQIEAQYMAFDAFVQPRLYATLQAIYRKLGAAGLVVASSSKAELQCTPPRDFMKSMHPIQASRLQRCLSDLDRIIVGRKHNASLIQSALVRAGLPILETPEHCDPVLLRYPVLFENKSELLRAAKQQRIELGDWFLSPVHPNMDNWDLARYTKGSCPASEYLSKRVINISTSPSFNPEEIERTVEFLRQNGAPCRPGDDCHG